MAFFPLLSQGSAAQYPISRTWTWLAAQTETPGGYVARSIDSKGRLLRWTLQYAELSDAEARAIALLYEQSRGGLRSFTFIDPLANLLAQSEDLTASVWSAGALASVVSGSGGPMAGRKVFALTNGSQSQSGISQSLQVPGGYTYCLSCYLRSAVPLEVTFSIGGLARTVRSGGLWTRRHVAADIGAQGAVAFGLSVPAGATLEVCGLQAEAQAAPSPYKPTVEAGGIYPHTRFVDDSLEITVQGPDRNSLATTLETMLPE